MTGFKATKNTGGENTVCNGPIRTDYVLGPLAARVERVETGHLRLKLHVGETHEAGILLRMDSYVVCAM